MLDFVIDDIDYIFINKYYYNKNIILHPGRTEISQDLVDTSVINSLFRIVDSTIQLGAYKFTEIRNTCLLDIENSHVDMEDVSVDNLVGSSILVVKTSSFSLMNVQIEFSSINSNLFQILQSKVTIHNVNINYVHKSTII